MPTERISITIDRDVLNEAKARAGSRGLSSLITDAVRRYLRGTHPMLELLDDEGAHKPPAATRKEVDEVWRRASSWTPQP